MSQTFSEQPRTKPTGRTPRRSSAGVVTTGERYRAPARLVGAQPKIRDRLPILLLTSLSLAACCLIFPSVGWGWLAYVCLVPWLVCVCAADRARFVYCVSFLFGLGFFLINVRWMFPLTPPGYFALCFYYALFFPLAAWPIRHMYTRHGVSVALTAPIAWVAAEYLRSVAALGFPWLLLAHSQYKNLTMIQISDLVGAYGVSFVLVMFNGWLTDLLVQPILIWRTDRATRLPIGSLTTLLVVLGTVIYGSAQRSKRFFEPGPKVAVVQHDFAMYVDSRGTHPELITQAYLDLARQAAEEKPDLIVLPETIGQGYLNEAFRAATPSALEEMRRRRYPPSYNLSAMQYLQGASRKTWDAFQALSTETGVPIILGSSSMEWKPASIPPRVDAFNSAFLIKPGRQQPANRYDKIHLVLFGEYVPFRYSYHSLYKRLNSMTPWGRLGIEYSLSPGNTYTIFEFDAASQGRRRYRTAVPICYEEVMPYIAREFVRGKGERVGKKNIDLLLSISNDGWFLHSAELEQHLAAAVFRAVENRIAVARSVNTGTSAIVHPNGKIHEQVTLSEDRLALLKPLSEVLGKLRRLAEGAESRVDSSQAYQAAREELNRFIAEECADAIGAVGTEYGYLWSELRNAASHLSAVVPDARRVALEQFQEQVGHKLEAVRRWQRNPWMAPGYSIAQIQCDDRVTIYARWGDWFAQGTLALVVMILLDWFLRRLRRLAGDDGAKEGQ